MSEFAAPQVDPGCGCAWAKSDPAGLARFVDPKAIRWVRPDIAPLDVPLSPAGRLELVRSLYEQLAREGVRYALEEWNPDDRCQTVRPPGEVIAKPAFGTCLDLSATFVGMCLGIGLLPVVAVTERHALVLVSLAHSADEWRSFGRQELAQFSPHPLTDVDALAAMVDDGRYIAVETTGFAATDALPATSPEGEGRVDRLLTFDRAVAAGRRRFDLPNDPLRFAIDVAATHGSGIGPQRICRAHRHVVVDEHVLDFGASGARVDRRDRGTELELRSLPVAQPPPPRPTRGVFGREREQAFLRSGASGGLVGVWGEDGIGKSELLRWLAYEPAPAELPDGIVYVRREGAGPLDLLQEVFERWFEPTERMQLTMSSAARYLGAKRARILIDDLDMSPGDVGSVLDVLAGSAVHATASGPSALAEGSSMAISPLSPTDATRLWTRESGLTVDDATMERLAATFSTLGTNPRSVSMVARAVATGDLLLDTLLSSGSAAMSMVSDTAAPVAAILQAAFPAFVHRRHLSDLVADVDAELEALHDRVFVQTGSPRYRWVAESTGAGLRDPSWDISLVGRLVQWLEGDPPPDEIIEDRELLLRSIDIAATAGRWTDVISLGRAIEPWFAIGNRWDAWRRVLSTLGDAARATGDPLLEAYCLHQAGTRALTLGDLDAALPDLERARETRERLGDREGADVSRHNLELARAPKPSLGRRALDLARRHPWLTVLAAVAVVVVIGLLVGGDDDDEGGGGGVDPGPSGSVDLTVSPLVTVGIEPLDLGAVPAGGVVSAELVVVNEGDGSVDVTAIGVDGNDQVALVASGTICEAVAPGDRCAVGVVFAPRREDIVQATVELEIGGERVTAPVSGSGVLGLILEPDDGFETVAGTRTAVQRFRLINAVDVAIDGVEVRVEPDDGTFVIGADCPNRFDAGEVCEFEVVSELPVGSDATGVLVASAAETAVEAALSLSGARPAEFEIRDPARFGEVLVGDSAAGLAVLANVGETFGSAVVVPVDRSGGFSVDPEGCREVEPGTECELIVTFVPTEARSYEHLVSFGEADVGILATGDGVLGSDITIEGDLDFGTVFLADGVPVQREVSIVNGGDRPGVIEAVEVVGERFALEVGAGECVGELDPGAACDLVVTFAPVQTGVFDGELIVDVVDAESIVRPIRGEFRLGGFATFAAVLDDPIRDQLGSFDDVDEWLEVYDTYEFDPDELEFTGGLGGPEYDAGGVFSQFRAMLIVLRNGGDAALVVESVVNEGPNAASFRIADGCSGVTLRPDPDGEYCLIGVAFDAADVPTPTTGSTQLRFTYGYPGLGPEAVTITGSSVIG